MRRSNIVSEAWTRTVVWRTLTSWHTCPAILGGTTLEIALPRKMTKGKTVAGTIFGDYWHVKLRRYDVEFRREPELLCEGR